LSSGVADDSAGYSWSLIILTLSPQKTNFSASLISAFYSCQRHPVRRDSVCLLLLSAREFFFGTGIMTANV
jgi:hypothetical protein